MHPSCQSKTEDPEASHAWKGWLLARLLRVHGLRHGLLIQGLLEIAKWWVGLLLHLARCGRSPTRARQCRRELGLLRSCGILDGRDAGNLWRSWCLVEGVSSILRLGGLLL